MPHRANEPSQYARSIVSHSSIASLQDQHSRVPERTRTSTVWPLMPVPLPLGYRNRCGPLPFEVPAHVWTGGDSNPQLPAVSSVRFELTPEQDLKLLPLPVGLRGRTGSPDRGCGPAPPASPWRSLRLFCGCPHPEGKRVTSGARGAHARQRGTSLGACGLPSAPSRTP